VSDPFDDRSASIRVGIDMDGVLADFNASWMARYERAFGTHLDVTMVRSWEGLHELTHFGSMAEFWEWVRSDGAAAFRDAPAMPGAVEVAERLARRHRLVIVSSKFDWAIPASLGWLAEHAIPAREVHFLWDKSRAGCDVYLDDAPHVLERLRSQAPGATVCRMVRPWNAPLEGVIDVSSWDELEAVVESASVERGAVGAGRGARPLRRSVGYSGTR
jgi:5'(3')-deoxyribonucleotidase